MRYVLALLFTIALLAVPVASANNAFFDAPNNGDPGAGAPAANDNCTGANQVGFVKSGGQNYSGPQAGPTNEPGAGHACD